MMAKEKSEERASSSTLRFTGTANQEEFNETCRQHEWWYHAYRFDNGFTVRGDYDIGRDIHAYGFPDDLTGCRVLDIGMGAGWFSFFFEQRGAEVTAWDPRGWCDFDIYGRYAYPPVESEKPTPDDHDEEGRPVYLSAVSGAFWKMRKLLGSRVRLASGRVYDINPELFDGKPFDLVFMGALLLHLRDPIGALMAARSVCSGQLYATTTLADRNLDDPLPHMEFPCAGTSGNAWWRPNKSCYRHWFLAAGFGSADVERVVPLTVDLPDPAHHNVHQILQMAVAQV